MGLVRVGMAPRLAGTGYQQFQQHWRTSHADAAGAIPNLRRYVQNHAVLVEGRPTLPYPGFDACSELTFDTRADMIEGFASPHYQEAVRADEDAFIDKSAFSMAVTIRHPVRGDEGAGSVKLVRLLRSHPASTAAELVDRLTGPLDGLLGAAVGHHVLVTDHAAHADQPPAVCDAVDILWFADHGSYHECTSSPEWDEAERILAGAVFGRADHLATEVVVV